MEQHQHIYPVENARGLDSRVRKWLQNPARMLKGRVREGMVVLELGCGPGFFTTEIARRVGKSGKVIAADLQEGMLELVRKKLAATDLESRVLLHKCDVDRIGVTEKVDLVVAFFMVHEVADKSRMLKELKAILKPGGSLYIVEFRMRPPKKIFADMVKIANEAGFVEKEEWASLLSRAVVLAAG